MYSSYIVAFDGKSLWSFNNDSARNLIKFGVDNSSSSHTDNLENDVLILGKGDSFGINRSFGAPKKKLVLILLKQRQNFA